MPLRDHFNTSGNEATVHYLIEWPQTAVSSPAKNTDSCLTTDEYMMTLFQICERVLKQEMTEIIQ